MEQNYENNASLNITAKVYPIKEPRENLLAFASVNIADAFAIRGVKVLQGRNGPFVSMPQMKNGKGEWQDICFPTTKEGREMLNQVVLAEYQNVKEAPDKAPIQDQQDKPQHAPMRNSYTR